MSTKLLHQVYAQEQAALAKLHNEGPEVRQPRRKWAVDALKRHLLEAEYAAGCRARRECRDLWAARDGAGFAVYRDPVTGMLTSGTEQSALRKSNAAFALNGLRQGVANRAAIIQGPNCAEWIARGDTMQDIAEAMDWMRTKGAGRPSEPDLRRLKPFLRLVLIAMAQYYADCDVGRSKWGLDHGPEHKQI